MPSGQTILGHGNLPAVGTLKNNMSKPRKRVEPGSPKWVFLQMTQFHFDPARAAAEDEMDRRWHEEAAEVMARVTREWPGDPNDWVGQLGALWRAMPPHPPGYHDRRHRCNRCGQSTELHDQYDAFYCGYCNRWVESKCRDVNCRFCSQRPERPLP